MLYKFNVWKSYEEFKNSTSMSISGCYKLSMGRKIKNRAIFDHPRKVGSWTLLRNKRYFMI